MTSAVIAETSGSVKRRFLVFQLAERVYALPAEKVAEVIRIPATARVPQAPRALIDVANLRGAVLPIVSLRPLLDLEGALGFASRAIVLEGAAPVAIVVDSIDALVTIGAERIETRAAQLSVERGERLNGAFPLDDGQDAAKIRDVQALLAEAFARRTRHRPRRRRARRSSLSTSRARNSLSISALCRRSSRCPGPLRWRRVSTRRSRE
jgi:purine-binding chemotaxis protein CheW